MPTITDIKRQKRSQERFSLFVDGAFAFALSDLDLSNSGLRVGQELTAGEVEEWRSRSLEGKAYDAALRQLSYRRRSRKELDDYLSRKEYDDETIGTVLTRLETMGLVDDTAFAQAWIADRQLLKPRSKRVLQVELMQKGIGRDIIVEALRDISGDDELGILMELAERKRRQSSYADPQKLIAYLARQGYGYDQIKKALARLDEI